MKKHKLFYTFVVMSVLVLLACRHQLDNLVTGGGGTGGGPANPPSTSNCNPDTVYFTNDIMPLISSNCTMSGCHDNVTHADGVNLTTYSRIKNYVVPGNAANSKLYKVVIRTDGERMPPPPMPPLTAEQKAKIQKWINQGARNNSCNSGCDTAIFTYSGAIRNMMTNKCAGCHNPANLGGGIDVSTYNGLRVVALNGKLYGSVAHQPGYSPMPQNAARLSDCEIRQVQKWINSGSPNN